MLHNLLHYQRAMFLRVKKGYSYNEIREEVPVAKSTLSLWLRDIELVPHQKHRLRQKQEDNWHNSGLGEWNRKKRQAEVTKIRVKAKRELPRLSERELLITGIMLYWAEGNKGGKEVKIANADPTFFKLIMGWFRDSLGLTDDRFTARIHYHAGQSEMLLREFWSGITDIPLEQFRKGFLKPPGTGHRKHYLQWGVLTVRVTKSANLFHHICGWRDGLIRDIVSDTH